MSLDRIATWFGVHHSTVMCAIARHSRQTGSPSLTTHDYDARLAMENAYHKRRRLERL
jgi:IS30 family transposase